MRDIAVTLIIFGALPFILWRPHIGVLVWTWLAFMSPHRLTWGFAYDFPFSYLVGAVTLVSLVLSQQPKKIPWTRETICLVVFASWMLLTTVFAAYPQAAWEQWNKVWKIILMVFVTLMLMQSKARINLLVCVLTLSLAFYGVKGGLFTVTGGGANHVRGPMGSFIGDNNSIALALVMTIPLLRYLQTIAPRAALRHAMTAAMLLTVLAVVGTQSRGGLVGLLAMGAFFWLKSRNKFFVAMLAALAVVATVAVMPQQWYDRMASIQDYEQDGSALGRINAWHMAFKLALHRPLGGGFETFEPEMFARYSPDPKRVHDSHSIYFEVLGEHGFVGLAFFLVLALMTWRTASWIIRRTKKDPANRWARELAAMVQVSLIGYASSGAFLGLAYFDLYYTLIAVVVLTKIVLLTGDQAAVVPAEQPHAGAPISPAAPLVQREASTWRTS